MWLCFVINSLFNCINDCKSPMTKNYCNSESKPRSIPFRLMCYGLRILIPVGLHFVRYLNNFWIFRVLSIGFELFEACLTEPKDIFEGLLLCLI